MSKLRDIVIGNWFQLPSGDTFEIVAYDEDEQTIEIQHFDGAVEEIDYTSWAQMEVSAVAAPEDYSGSLDVAKEDYGVDLDEHVAVNHSNPLDSLDVTGSGVADAFY